MKPFAIILIVLVIAALVGVGYLYVTSTLEVTFTSCVATDPLTREDYFASLKSSVDSGTFVGVRHTSGDLPAPEDCLFYTWTVHLDNRTALPADTVEIRVTPMSGDILVVGDPTEHTVPARGEADLSVTALTARSMHSVREATVTWYMWGLPFSARVTLGK